MYIYIWCTVQKSAHCNLLKINLNSAQKKVNILTLCARFTYAFKFTIKCIFKIKTLILHITPA